MTDEYECSKVTLVVGDRSKNKYLILSWFLLLVKTKVRTNV